MVDWEQKILQNGDTNVYGQVKQWLLLQLFGSYLELLHEKGGRGEAEYFRKKKLTKSIEK